jgi:hypothetical protein
LTDMLNRIAIIVFLVSFVVLGANAQEAEEFDYQGAFDKANVFVLVETYSGFGWQRISAGLACDGHLRIAGAYKDTTTIRAYVSPDTSLAFINDLLAIDFFKQPEVFRAECGEAVPTDDGQISLMRKTSIDGDSTRITLRFGSWSHSVKLVFPAYGAPQALIEWERRFRALVNEHAGWEVF